MRALIVEDDASIADFVVRGLREAGFAVDVAADGEAALDRMRQHTYDVAVVDLMLPKRDGLSVIDQMRAHAIDTPVLMLSARRSVDDRVKGLQAGGDGGEQLAADGGGGVDAAGRVGQSSSVRSLRHTD